MPGAAILHGYNTSASPAGEGGAARVQSAATAAGLHNVGFGSNLSFFVWLILIGVVVPAAIVGGLKAGRFQFVFRGR